MSRRVFLPHPSRWKLLLLAGVGVVLYVAAVVVGETYKDRSEVGAQLGHDALLALSAFAVGLSGFAGTVEAWRDWQLRRRTGRYVLTLVDDARYVAGRLTALTWEPVRPLLSYFRDLPSDDVWVLLKDRERGHFEMLRRHIDLQQVTDGPTAPPDPEAWSKVQEVAERNVHLAADAAESLHALALELADYQDIAAAQLLTATAQLRVRTRAWQEKAEIGGDHRSLVGRHGVGVATVTMKPLTQVAEALAVTEAKTLAVLRGTEEGRELAAEREKMIAARRDAEKDTIDHAILIRETANNVDELQTGIANLNKLIHDPLSKYPEQVED
jgi:hypothetical protein